jgi:DNA sulfur modification protein DndB
MPDFEIRLPAIRGTQAGRPVFIALCPAKFIPRLIPPNSAEVASGAFAREVDHTRAQDICRYLVNNPSSYALPTITCLIEGEFHFVENRGKGIAHGSGVLTLPLASHIVILDGLNRRAGIEAALKLSPGLADEGVPLLFFVDADLGRSEQLLSDLRRNGSRSTRSQGILCDWRDENSRIARQLLERVEVFSGMTETVRSTISNRSLKLFTFSGIYHATGILLSGRQNEPYSDRLESAVEFWTAVSECMPDWQRAKAAEVSPAELRCNYVHAHAIALAALARAGKSLLQAQPRSWKRKLKPLRSLNWSRSNRGLWEGRAMIAGRLSKSNMTVLLTGNVIKRHLSLSLTREEQDAEDQLSTRARA